MRKFVIKVTMFIAVQMVILGGFILLSAPDTSSWISAGIDKRARLRSAPDRRIVFVGGSSVCFGIDSERVHEKLGLNPVNMGLHAGLGLNFILAEAQTGLRSNDIVVVSFEYEHFLRDQTQWALLAQEAAFDPWLVVRSNPRSWADQGFRQMLAGLINSCRFFHPYVDDPRRYKRNAFNVYGDVAQWQGTPPTLRRAENVPAPEQLAQAGRRLAEFQEWCARRHVTVYWVYPPMADFAFDPKLAAKVQEQLNSRPAIVQLNNPANAVLPVNYFQDTEYHLGRKGAALRTQDIIERLRVAWDAAPRAH